MRFPPILILIALVCTFACGGDPDPTTPPTPSSDAACLEQLSYRLTITNPDGTEVLSLNASDYDASTTYELTRLRSHVWGINFEGTRGLARVELGLPGSSCGTRWTKVVEYPAGAPTSVVFNTGEPLLTGLRWEQISLTGLATFPNLTVEGEIRTAVLTENLEALIRMTGPEDSDGDQCVVEHVLHFEVVK